jgi:hypothetical protein
MGLGGASVLVMEAAEVREGHDLALGWGLDGPLHGSVSGQRQVGARLVVVRKVAVGRRRKTSL